MKTLKTIITTTLLFFSGSISFAQENTKLHIDSFYSNKSEHLIYSEIYEFDSLSQEDLNTKIKNWAGLHFVNMKEVLVSETKDQMVFCYLTEDFFMKTLTTTYYSWYFRLSIQIKDNKIKVSIYDDGNALWSRSDQYPTPARKYKFSVNFNEDGTSMKMYTKGMLEVKKSCVKLSNDINNSIKIAKLDTKNNDW